MASFKRKLYTSKESIATLKSSVKQMDEFDQNQMKSTLIYEILLIYKILDSRYAK